MFHRIGWPTGLAAVGIFAGMWASLDGKEPFHPCLTAACEIRQVRVVSLRDPSVTKPGYSLFVVPFDGDRFVMAAQAGTRLVVFGADGRVHASLGGSGRDQGQFQRISHLLPAGDGTVLAFDYRLRRLVPLGRDGVLGEGRAMPYVPAFRLAGGDFVVAEQIRTAELIGHPIHVVRPSGEVVRSFGADVPEYRSDLHQFTDRIVAPGSDGTIWAVAPARYTIERWSTDGKRLARVDVKSPWFTSGPRPMDERVRPAPIIEAIWEDAGLVTVLLRDADANWRAPAGANVERPFDPDEYDKLYDWVLEAVDPGSGRILASLRLPTATWGRAPSPLISTRLPNSAGLDVWRAELVQLDTTKESDR